MYDGYTIIPNGRPTWAPLLAASGQQLAVSNGNPTSHEPLATIFPPLLPNRGGPSDRFRRGRPVKASRYALRASRSVVVSLSLSRRNAASESEKKAVARGSWLVKPCLMDLLCISPFIRGGPPFGTAPTQAPVGAFLRAEGYSKRCCQFEFVAAQRHLSPSELRTANC